jgi:hypothetical protein
LKSLLRNKKALSQTGAAVILVAIIVFASVFSAMLYGAGYFTPKTGTQQNNNNDNNDNNDGLSIANYGVHSMSVGGLSGFAGVTTSYSEATQFVVQWVSPSTGQILNPSTSNGTGSINVPQADNGVIYAVVEPVTASAMYVDSDAIVAKNAPYVVSQNYGPVFGNGVNYWYFGYSFNNAVPTYNSAPSYSFAAYFKPYGAITLSSPADITSIGTASVDEWIPWTTTFASVNHAFAITKIVLTVNTTTTSNKIMFDDFTVPWSSIVVSSAVASPSQSTLGSTDFTCQISQGRQGAAIVQYITNTQNSLSFKAHVTCGLTAGDVIQATLTIYGLNVDGKTVVTTTDTVALSA